MQVAGNLQLGAVAAFIAGCIEWGLSQWGHPLPQNLANELPAVIFFVIAHASDLVTGQNKPNAK